MAKSLRKQLVGIGAGKGNPGGKGRGKAPANPRPVPTGNPRGKPSPTSNPTSSGAGTSSGRRATRALRNAQATEQEVAKMSVYTLKRNVRLRSLGATWYTQDKNIDIKVSKGMFGTEQCRMVYVSSKFIVRKIISAVAKIGNFTAYINPDIQNNRSRAIGTKICTWDELNDPANNLVKKGLFHLEVEVFTHTNRAVYKLIPKDG